MENLVEDTKMDMVEDKVEDKVEDLMEDMVIGEQGKESRGRKAGYG